MAAPHITKLTVACCTLYCSAPLSRPAEIQQAQNLLPALAATLPCHGPIAVVYPEGVWYDRLTPLVLERIIEEHLLGGHTVSAHVMMGSRAADHDPNVLPALDITRWVFVGVSKQLGLCVCVMVKRVFSSAWVGSSHVSRSRAQGSCIRCVSGGCTHPTPAAVG